MAQSFTTDHLQALLAFPFREPRGGQKLLVGFALNLASFIVPIIPALFFYGYCAPHAADDPDG